MNLGLTLTHDDPWWFGHIDGQLIVQARDRDFAVEALCRALRHELGTPAAAEPLYPEGLERKVAALQPVVINGVPYAYDADRDTCREQRDAQAKREAPKQSKASEVRTVTQPKADGS